MSHSLNITAPRSKNCKAEMIAVTRPDGDELAKVFNGFLSRTEVRKLEVGDKFPIMCENGDHYLVQIKSIAQGVAKVHFVGMTNEHFYEGPLQNLYITDEPRHLTRRIQKKQIYHKEYTTIRKTKQEEAAPPVKKLSAFHANTRYSDEFLSKPYKTDHRKRRNPGDTVTPPPSPTTTRSKHSDFTTSHNADSTRPGSVSIAFKRNVPAAAVAPGLNRTSNNMIATKSNVPAIDLLTRSTRSTVGPTLSETKANRSSNQSILNHSSTGSSEKDTSPMTFKSTSTGRNTRNNPSTSSLASTPPKEGLLESSNNTRAARERASSTGSAAATKEPDSSDRATRSKRTYDIHSEMKALDNVLAESAQRRNNHSTVAEHEKDRKGKPGRTNSTNDTEFEVSEVPSNKRRRTNSTASEKSITAVDNIANISGSSITHDNKHQTAGTAISNSGSSESHSSATDVITAPTKAALSIDPITTSTKHHKGKGKTTAKVRPPIDYSIATPANGYPELQPGEIILSSRLSGCGKLRATYTKRNKMTYLSYIDVPPASTDSGVPSANQASNRLKANDTFLITNGSNDADSYAERDIICLMSNDKHGDGISISNNDQIPVSVVGAASGTAKTTSSTVTTATAATTTVTTAASSTTSSSSTSICADASLSTLRVVPTIHVSSMKYVPFHPVHTNEDVTSKDKSTADTNMDTTAERSTSKGADTMFDRRVGKKEVVHNNEIENSHSDAQDKQPASTNFSDNNQSVSSRSYPSGVNIILAELNNLSKLSASELKRRHIDPQAFNTLLSAQIKLAKVTKEMLGWED